MLLLISTVFLIPAAVFGMPTEDSTAFPILRPESLPLLSSSEDLDAIVVEAADGSITTTEESTTADFDTMDCLLPPLRGPCRAIIDSWFYNATISSCQPFQYSGCQGNGNRFAQAAVCMEKCGNAAAVETTVASSTTTTTLAPSSIKPKKPILPDCPKFDGCPNKCVIIQDRSDRGCKKCLCSQVTEEAVVKNATSTGSVSGLPSNSSDEDGTTGGSPQLVCNQPATPRGTCRAMLTRYRYDPQTKNCVQFHYGGCEKGGNNFVTKEKCVEYCRGQ